MEDDKFKLKVMTERQLFEWLGGRSEGSEQYLAGNQELHRRNKKGDSMRANIALGIAGVSLIVSIIAILKA